MVEKYRHYFIFFIVTISYFLLRFSTYPYVYENNFLNLIDPDSYYHLRRVLYTLNNFPKMLDFDPFLSYPRGDYCPWPPFYDFLSAGITKIISDTRIIPFLNPFYFFLALTIIYFSVYKKEGITTSLTTSVFLSITGILYLFTSFGRFDHHSMELLIITLLYLTFFRYFTKKDIPSLLLFSFFCVLSFFNWPGALIYFVPVFMFVIYEFLKENLDDRILKGLFVAFHITAIVMAVYLKITKTNDFPPYSYKFLSAFQRDFCFFISVVFITLYFHKTKRINRLLLWLGNAIIIGLMFHRLFYEIFKGLMFVTKGDKLMILIEESSPLFFSRFYSLYDELKRAISLFTPFIFLSPYFIYKYYKKRGADLVFFYCLFFLLLTLIQLRFGYFFTLGYSFMIAVVLKDLLEKHLKILIVVFLVITSIIFYRDLKTSSERFLSEEIKNSLIFLRETTPYKEKFEKGETPYGVLASWHLGHYIIEIAKRPAVAHNFINVAINSGEKEFINALFSKREDEVLKIIDRNKSRYLILENPDENIITDWYAISSEKNPYIDKNKNINSKASELFLFNLYHFYGITPPFQNTPKNLRLIYESSKKKNIKIFERVKSAKIIYRGNKNPLLKMLIKTPYNTFFYISLGEPAENGRIFNVPYSLDSPYPVKAELVNLELNGSKIPLNIKEEDVTEGKTIEIKY
ncbi:MAG: hypothetical protein N2999_01330 [Proteobacteria bacterium]|nr:hypothetical protein [Pseudomonadota bacterium]